MALIRKNHTNRQKSQRSEKAAANILGGKVQVASGAMQTKWLKGDVVLDDYLVEDKVTSSDSYSLNQNTLSKIFAQARNIGKKPLLRVSMSRGTYYVLDEVTLVNLLNKQ